MNETQHYILCRTPSSNGGYWLVAAYVNDIGYIPRSIVDIVQTRPDSGKAMQIARHLLKDPAPFQFATGSDIVINKNPDELMKLARYLDDHPGQAIEITGHADSTGDATFNNELSARRAKNVSQLLVAAYGIDQSQLNIRAMGEQSPIVRNETEEGLRLNRRVELRIKPMLKGEQ
ncbi:OmpA family protein [Endozoicomonas sp. ALE010]